MIHLVVVTVGFSVENVAHIARGYVEVKKKKFFSLEFLIPTSFFLV